MPTSVKPDESDDLEQQYELAYQESVRGLTQQAGVVDNARTRAGLLITAANVVTALLATQAIKERPGLGLGGWLAVVAFAIAMALALYILLPWKGWNFAFDAKKLVDMIERSPGYSLHQLHRRLALLNEESQVSNQTRLGKMFDAFRWGCIFLSVEVALWVLVLARISAFGVVL